MDAPQPDIQGQDRATGEVEENEGIYLRDLLQSLFQTVFPRSSLTFPMAAPTMFLSAGITSALRVPL